jgi:hypothetical protein
VRAPSDGIGCGRPIRFFSLIGSRRRRLSAILGYVALRGTPDCDPSGRESGLWVAAGLLNRRLAGGT